MATSRHPLWLRHRDAASLARGYSRPFRLVELSSILVFFGMLGCLFARLWHPARAIPGSSSAQ